MAAEVGFLVVAALAGVGAYAAARLARGDPDRGRDGWGFSLSRAGLMLLAAGFAVATIEACLLFVFAVTGRGWATIGSVLPLAVTGWATWACGQGMVAALTTAQRHQSRHPWEAVLPIQGRWLNYALAAVFGLVAGVTGGAFALFLAVGLVALVGAP